MRARLQQAGAFLAGMVVPNIGAFIAWGFITALFIPAGWVPNQHLARLVEPMILYLLPILIGFSGGRLVYGTRGGVVGAVATMGVVAGSSVPMFLGAMIGGPLGGWLIKRFDQAVKARVPVGFEMLVANFSAGLIGMGLTLVAFSAVGSVVEGLTMALAAGARSITRAGLLPLIALVIEPAKVLFVNNAINHGILSPLGVAEVNQTGKSIFFLLETNPGPGLGLLAAGPIVARAGGFGEAQQVVRAEQPRALPRTVFFVCEAGMGSSVMGQSLFERKLEDAHLKLSVEHAALSELPSSAQLVVAHRSLLARLKEVVPEAQIHAVDEFLNAAVYEELIKELRSTGDPR